MVGATGIELTVVGGAAVLTSILSAVAGLGGGVILLAVIAQFHAPTVAIPIQGAIQLVSNSARAWFLRDDVAWKLIGWTALPLLPASLIGVALATSLPESAMRVVLGLFVLYSAWRQRIRTTGWLRAPKRPTRPERPLPLRMSAVGAASGFLNTTVGASGPFTAPFFRAATATHVAFVATAASSQVLAHAAKLMAFSGSGWDLTDHVSVIVIGAAGVVVGSWIGTRLLGRADDRQLDFVFRWALTALGIRLLVAAAL